MENKLFPVILLLYTLHKIKYFLFIFKSSRLSLIFILFVDIRMLDAFGIFTANAYIFQPCHSTCVKICPFPLLPLCSLLTKGGGKPLLIVVATIIKLQNAGNYSRRCSMSSLVQFFISLVEIEAKIA